MKILVTGGTGFIGRNLTRILLDNKYDVHCIVRIGSDTSLLDNRIKIFKYNNDIDSLITYFNNEKFDGVVHLASLYLTTHFRHDISNLIFSNIQFGVEILEACKAAAVKWFINTGTTWQHYKNEEYNPVNLYAATKEAFIKIAKYYTETSNLIFTTLKLSDTYGPNDTRNKIFNLWLKISKSGEILEMSHGEQIVDIVFIEDVLNAYLIMINYLMSDRSNEYNLKSFVIKSKEQKSLKELAKIFETVTSSKLNIKWGAKPYREREVMLPYKNGEMVPGWEPRYTVAEGIKKMVGIKDEK